MTLAQTERSIADLVEYYFDQPWSDGLPVVPPTPELVEQMVDALGGDGSVVEARVPPRWGTLTRQVLAVNMVLAGCKTDYAPVVKAAVQAICDPRFNLNGIQATTHVTSPLLVVNGPIRSAIGMNSGGNAFGSGNRANATIGRAIRLVMLAVGGGIPGDLDKSTLGHPGKYTFCIAENEEVSPWAPYHVEHGYAPEDSTVFAIAAEAPHSVTNHVSDDPEGILDSIASGMRTIAHNNSVLGGSCTIVIGPEHAETINSHGWTRHDVRSYLWMNSANKFREIAHDHRYGKVYNRNLPKWYRRDLDSPIPIVETPDDLHLFVVGGLAGRFSAVLPGWSRATVPVLKPIENATGQTPHPADGPDCSDGTCRL
ncbi:hypothetical protein [Saccharopolyspora spinosa]|uniref:Thioredoxin n=1 Tax=Saccharopolyspora spinosa TaxID=60894 RepID=A0A2N3Y1A2_SACSN|nr:hypothetical protein [Saccharopolyspora spinosa]PKW16670.1 hypothetical protein A8926_4527 [Saccharopolyspora spinosa]